MTGFGRARNFVRVTFAAFVVAAAMMSPVLAADDVPARFMGDGGVIRVPTNPASTGSWTQAVIQKYQLDKKYNIQIDSQISAITQMTANAIQAGSVDMGTFQFVQIGLMRRQGAKIVAVAPFLEWGANQVVVPVNSPLKTIGDLKGKKLGIFNNVDIDWLVVQAFAKKDFNLNPKEIYTQVAGIAVLQGLIQTGELDATVIFNNLTPPLVAGGKVKVLVEIRDLIGGLGLPTMPFLFMTVREEYAKEHPQNVRAYLAAYREAVDLLFKDEEIWRTHGEKLGLSKETIPLLREVLRKDIVKQFKPSVEADVNKAFAFILKEAPEAVGGLTEMQTGWITLDYQ